MPKRSLRSKAMKTQKGLSSEKKKSRNDLNLKWDHDENVYSDDEDSDNENKNYKKGDDDDEEEELSAEQKRKK
jgi:hypothetical protein